jgi:polyvinyl alcohol dehydrogenase (cytochrome)
MQEDMSRRVFLQRTGRSGAVMRLSTSLVLVWPLFAQGWPFSGHDVTNSRATLATTITSANVSHLKIAWSVSVADDVSATPAVDTGGALYFPDWSGNLYKLDGSNGSVIWEHTISEYLSCPGMISRTGPALSGSILVIGASAPLSNPQPCGAWAAALNQSDGSLVWATQLDANVNALATGSAVVYNGAVYIGVSSSEELLAYPTFRGSVAALSLADGHILWQTYMVPQGYTGAAIWSGTPAVDVARNQLYVTTGNNYTVPNSVLMCEQLVEGNPGEVLACQDPANYADSIVALDLGAGSVKWGARCAASGEDNWISACKRGGPACPDPEGPDEDFGDGAHMLGANLVGAGQKSGAYWALDADTGQVIWTTQVGPGGIVGGIQWGSAADGKNVYAAISNTEHLTYTLASGQTWSGGSWAALNAATGKFVWQVADPTLNTVHRGLPALDIGPVSVGNDVVYVASMSGWMVALSASNGQTLWGYKAPGSVNAGPAVVGNSVYWGTGYHHFPPANPSGTASNVFYAFAVN